ncbi:TPA: AP2/ERF family transcription factor [Klebsiella pneumoniae]|uniref:AP2/ERF family transcription factor n=1 Tax=Klebsiella pneumoniae TaxID=573 RepID=UPI00197C3ADC|nr:AP2/ERF family transcription factor [Klebsiella pneumoniae]HBQ0511231.1 AP2/ERF family transcription factor [Klebsiella pneumoniae]HBS3535033.1 AP2/ERF family transcription factor [Klebsiella pneumoniae]HBU8546800.1 AP2/ERF family transcription factor [Klebsiella pneumoniae]HBV0662788.1 AP2/ERF family transcription factor [Klebsiella pneumoniae]
MRVKFDVGEKVGMLTLIEPFTKDEKGVYKGKFYCDCGRTKIIRLSYVKSGRTKSCGCLKVEAKKTHGLSSSSEYKIWDLMIQRCENPNDKRYKDYGGRGITVCHQWHDFSSFYADMGSRPDGFTLDRIDNDKGYSPENCRWATPSEQQLNRRKVKGSKSRFVGVTKRPSGRWSARITVNYKGIYLGDYDTEEAASEAYQKAKEKVLEEFELMRKQRGIQ